jgi:hypothetical protein
MALDGHQTLKTHTTTNQNHTGSTEGGIGHETQPGGDVRGVQFDCFGGNRVGSR